MNREQARVKFEAKKRFASQDGKILVREVALLAAIASLKTARRPAQAHTTRMGCGLIG